MKRSYIAYGGIEYTVAHTDLEELKATFVTAVQMGTPTWVRVNHGEGTYQETGLPRKPTSDQVGEARTLIATGVPKTVIAEKLGGRRHSPPVEVTARWRRSVIGDWRHRHARQSAPIGPTRTS